MSEVTYERPVAATLIVRLANGEEFEATADDAARFGFLGKDQLLEHVREVVKDATGVDPKDSGFAPLWNVVLMAALNPAVLGNDEAMASTKQALNKVNADIMALHASQMEF